jgi:RNA recognition motif-containing protein
MNIYVGSLSFKTKEDELKNAFEEFGEVSAARIITDKYSGRSKGFGFVEMPNDAEARKAIEGLNGKELDDRKIIVNESVERERTERRPSFRDRDGGNRREHRNRY